MAILAGVLVTSCGGGGGDSGTSAAEQAELTDRNYMPLATGNMWLYEDDAGNGVTTVSVTGTGAAQGASGFQLHTRYLADNTGSDSLLVKTAAGLQEILLDTDPISAAVGSMFRYRLPLRRGAVFVQVDRSVETADLDGDGRNDRLLIHSEVTVVGAERVQTRAGEFEACLHLKTGVTETLTGTSAGTLERVTTSVDEWFAPDVGLVRTVNASRTNDGAVTTSATSLTGYRVADRSSDEQGPRPVTWRPVSGSVAVAPSDVTVEFDEAIDPLSFATGGGVEVLRPDGSKMPGTTQVNGKTVRFIPQWFWETGTYVITVYGAKDLLGNETAQTTSQRIVLDSSVLAVTQSFPADGSVIDDSWPTIQVRFSEPFVQTSVTSSTVMLRDSQGVTVLALLSIVDERTIAIKPAAKLTRDRTYQVQVTGGLRTASGGTRALDSTFRFSVSGGQFAAPAVFSPYVGFARTPATGDLNGDGAPDLAFTSPLSFVDSDSYALYVAYSQQGSGLQAARRVMAGSLLQGCMPTSLLIRDVDGDGVPEVFAGGDFCRARIYKTLPDGSLTLSQELSEESAGSLRLADMDGDGRLELLAYRFADHAFGIWTLDGGGTGTRTGSIPLPSELGLGDWVIGDVSGDGRPDLVMTQGTNLEKSLMVIRQNPDGSFAAPVYRESPTLTGFSHVAVGDLNGDGRGDIAVTLEQNSPAYVGVFYQGADGSIGSMARIDSYDIPGSVRIADMDADGRLDLVVGHDGWDAVGVYLQQEDGSLRSERLYAVSPRFGGFASMVIADLSRDGRPDLVVGDYLLVQRIDTAPTVTPAAMPHAGLSMLSRTSNRPWARWIHVAPEALARRRQ